VCAVGNAGNLKTLAIHWDGQAGASSRLSFLALTATVFPVSRNLSYKEFYHDDLF
jgi:hypothetical protein